MMLLVRICADSTEEGSIVEHAVGQSSPRLTVAIISSEANSETSPGVASPARRR